MALKNSKNTIRGKIWVNLSLINLVSERTQMECVTRLDQLMILLDKYRSKQISYQTDQSLHDYFIFYAAKIRKAFSFFLLWHSCFKNSWLPTGTGLIIPVKDLMPVSCRIIAYLFFLLSFAANTEVFCIFFWRARVCWLLHCLCRPLCIIERCLDTNPESCRSKQARYQLSHPSPSLSQPSPSLSHPSPSLSHPSPSHSYPSLS